MSSNGKPQECSNCGGVGFVLGLDGTHILAAGCDACGGRPPTKRALERMIRALLDGMSKRLGRTARQRSALITRTLPSIAYNATSIA